MLKNCLCLHGLGQVGFRKGCSIAGSAWVISNAVYMCPFGCGRAHGGCGNGAAFCLDLMTATVSSNLVFVLQEFATSVSAMTSLVQLNCDWPLSGEWMSRLTRLTAVIFSGSNPGPACLPEVLTTLTLLESCAFSDCHDLQLPMNIGSLRRLSSLDLSRSSRLQSLPPSFTDLSALQTCNLHGCRFLRKLPDGMDRMAQLRALDVAKCERLSAIPEVHGLHLQNLSLIMGWKLSDLQKAGLELDLSNMHRLRNLPLMLKDLQILHLRHCEILQEVPATLSCLRQLDLSYCFSLQSLPEAMGSWPFLEALDLTGCTRLSADFAAAAFSSMTCLNLSGCPSSVLPQSQDHLPNLMSLYLRGGTSREQIGPCCWHYYRPPRLWRTMRIRHLPEFLETHPGLQHLDLSYNGSLPDLWPALGYLDGLQVVHADGLPAQYY